MYCKVKNSASVETQESPLTKHLENKGRKKSSPSRSSLEKTEQSRIERERNTNRMKVRAAVTYKGREEESPPEAPGFSDVINCAVVDFRR